MNTEFLEKQILAVILEKEKRELIGILFDKFSANLFDDTDIGNIFQFTKEHFQKYNEIPNDDIISNSVSDSKELIKTVKQIELGARKYLVDEFNEYWKDQQIRKGLILGADYINKGNHDGFWSNIDNMRSIQSEQLSGGNNFEMISLADISRIEDTEQNNFIIDGLIPVGLNMLAGKPKRGKSWCCYNLSIGLGVGHLLFGKIRIPRTESLYLALEDTKQRVKRRAEQLIQGSDLPNISWISINAPRLGSGLIEYLEEWMKKRPNIKLIMIDTLEKVAPEFKRSFKQSNIYTADYNKMTPLKDFADKHNIAVLVVHHLNKKEDDRDPLDLISGSTGLTGAVDTIMIMNREVKSADIRLFITGRDIEEKELAFNFENGWWTLLGDADNYDFSEQQRKILDIIPDDPDMIAASDIINYFSREINQQVIKNQLSKMVVDGTIFRPKRGFYSKK